MTGLNFEDVKIGDRVKDRAGVILTVTDMQAVPGLHTTGNGWLYFDGQTRKSKNGKGVSLFTRVEPEIDWTKPVETENGTPVTFISDQGRDAGFPILAYIGDWASIYSFSKTGDKNGSISGRFKVRNVAPKPKQIVQYFNFYESGLGCHYSSRAEADAAASKDRLGCKKVILTEGEWDE
jgi:hypothetical protein